MRIAGACASLLCLLSRRTPSSAIVMSSPLQSRMDTMKSAAAAREPFSDSELDDVVDSLKCLAPPDAAIDWTALRGLFAARAHLNHKDWTETCTSAEQMAAILGGPEDAAFRCIFSRVLEGGGWDAATAAASTRPTDAKPHIVLVTGLNGIRKTTSVNSPWFKELLSEALAGQMDDGETHASLPAGSDSFFRQLDFMIATLALAEFKRLYTIEDVPTYAQYKDAIFARYRTAAEMLGVLLVRAAQRARINVMVETSGRDVGMYKYIEHLQPDASYRKLVINFGINELIHAEKSVDRRMLEEMQLGRAALAKAASEPLGVIQANAGGPYGSAVLAGVQADSVKVWQQIVSSGEGDVGHGWRKASIHIIAKEDAPWQASAAGEESRAFEFGSAV